MRKVLALLVLLVVTSCQLSGLNLACNLCHDVISEYQRSIPRRPTELFLDFVAYKYCVKKHLQKPNVCKGAVRDMMDSIVNSVWRHYTDPHAICHKLRFCPKEYKIRNLTADINKILSGKPDKQW
jgi:sphingomyelin phosphodiesterase